jgi:hypothetical protein
MNGTTGGHRDRRQRPRRRRAGMLAAAAAGVAVFATACGGSGRPVRPAGASHPAGAQQYHAYSACMRSHGAPFWPEPSPVPHGVFDPPYAYPITARILGQEHGPGWQAALSACRKLAPQNLPFTAAQIGALHGHLRKLAACMRSHGISRFPSPVVGLSGGGFPSPGPGVNPDSVRFLAAQRACWVYAPGSGRKAARGT